MQFYEYEITSDFGSRSDPFTNKQSNHRGIDFALPLNTEVFANVSGTVSTVANDTDGYGNYIVVNDGSGKLHYYAHLNKASVSVGDSISKGDLLGLSGSTGRSTGPHLHYEVRDTSSGGIAIDPDTEFNVLATDPEFLHEYSVPLDSDSGTEWWNLKGKIKNVVFNIFKFIVIALLVVCFVLFVTKALDINIF